MYSMGCRYNSDSSKVKLDYHNVVFFLCLNLDISLPIKQVNI